MWQTTSYRSAGWAPSKPVPSLYSRCLCCPVASYVISNIASHVTPAFFRLDMSFAFAHAMCRFGYYIVASIALAVPPYCNFAIVVLVLDGSSLYTCSAISNSVQGVPSCLWPCSGSGIHFCVIIDIAFADRLRCTATAHRPGNLR